MTIVNGQAILAADLNAMVSFSTLSTNDVQQPGMVQLFLPFANLVASTAAERRRCVWVAPCDLILEVLAIEAADHTVASTTRVDVTGDGELATWPTAISGATGAGITKLARNLYDNTKSPSENFALASKAFRVFRKGTTLTVVAQTTSVATPSAVNAILVFREFYNRE